MPASNLRPVRQLTAPYAPRDALVFNGDDNYFSAGLTPFVRPFEVHEEFWLRYIQTAVYLNAAEQVSFALYTSELYPPSTNPTFGTNGLVDPNSGFGHRTIAIRRMPEVPVKVWTPGGAAGLGYYLPADVVLRPGRWYYAAFATTHAFGDFTRGVLMDVTGGPSPLTGLNSSVYALPSVSSWPSTASASGVGLGPLTALGPPAFSMFSRNGVLKYFGT